MAHNRSFGDGIDSAVPTYVCFVVHTYCDCLDCWIPVYSWVQPLLSPLGPAKHRTPSSPHASPLSPFARGILGCTPGCIQPHTIELALHAVVHVTDEDSWLLVVCGSPGCRCGMHIGRPGLVIGRVDGVRGLHTPIRPFPSYFAVCFGVGRRGWGIAAWCREKRTPGEK